MLVQQSIFAILTGLLCSHLPYIINHHKYFELLHANLEHTDCTSSSSVTLSEHRGHSNWNQTIEFSSA